jgi:hypothetical protein
VNETALLKAHGMTPLQADRVLGKSVSVAWLADVDRVGHARLTRGAVRFACGCPVFAEKFAWPPLTKCVACVAALEETPSIQG